MRTYYGDAFDALAAWGYGGDSDRRPAIRAERPCLCAPRPRERRGCAKCNAPVGPRSKCRTCDTPPPMTHIILVP